MDVLLCFNGKGQLQHKAGLEPGDQIPATEASTGSSSRN